MTFKKVESKISLGYYKPGFGNNDHQVINELQAYEIIKQGSNQEVTERIQAKHKQGLLSDWSNIDKSPYQNDKAQAFDSVTFSLESPRAKGSKVIHTGLICLDIDENTKEELDQFREQVISGNIPYARACALSVSGIYTGAFWLNIKCEFDNVTYESSPALFKLLHLTESSTQEQIHKALHKAYESFIIHLLSKFKIEVHKRSYTQPRYLSFDAGIYVNTGANVISVKELVRYLKEYETKKKAITRKKAQKKLLSGTSVKCAFDLCKMYAEGMVQEKENCEDALKHKRLYSFYFGLKANRLGIDTR